MPARRAVIHHLLPDGTIRVMGVTTEIDGDTATLRLKGRFDLLGYPAFRQAMRGVAANVAVAVVRIDFVGVSSLGSSALGALLLAHEEATGAGKVVVLLNANDDVRKVLDAADFQRFFTFLWNLH